MARCSAIWLSTFASMCLVLGSGAAYADKLSQALEEVTVTAGKREESAQAVPIALTVVTAVDLVSREITGLEGVLAAVPNITSVPYVNSSNTFFLYMRGVGFVDPGQVGSEGSVGIYKDGFYIARPQALAFDLGDVARVEVLRGPQGTLYGRNTIGGAVNVISRDPSGTFGIKQSLDFGSFHELRSLSSVDLPEVDDFSCKLEFLRRSRDGFITNPGQAHDFGERDETGGRVQVLWNGPQGLRADYFFELSYLDSTPDYVVDTQFEGQSIYPGIAYVAPTARPDRAYRPLALPLSTTRTSGQGLTFTWNPADSLTLKSLTGYRELNASAFQNYDESTGLADFRTSSYIHDRQVTEEIQAGGTEQSVHLNYLVGAFLFYERGLNFVNSESLAPFPFPAERDAVRTNSEAIYGELTWSPITALDLTVGARYTHDQKSGQRREQIGMLTPVDEASKLTYSEVSPGVSVTYRWTVDISTYLKMQKGYKGGAPNYLAPAGRFGIPYGPEHLTSYEVGVKSYWLERRLQLNLALFESHYRDEQEAIQVAPYIPQYDAFNVGRQTIKGVELDTTFRLSGRLTVAGSYTFLNPHIDSLPAPADTLFDPSINPFSPYHVGQDVKGLFAAGSGYAPRHSYSVMGDYTIAQLIRGDLAIHLEYRWQGERYGAGSSLRGWQFATAPAFGLLNANVSFALPLADARVFRVSLWGQNLLNEDKPSWVAGAGGSIVPISPATAGYTARTLAAWVQPRTLGVSLTLQL